MEICPRLYSRRLEKTEARRRDGGAEDRLIEAAPVEEVVCGENYDLANAFGSTELQELDDASEPLLRPQDVYLVRQRHHYSVARSDTPWDISTCCWELEG